MLDSIGETGEYSLNNVATGPDNEDCHSAAPFNRHSSVELFTPGYDQHEYTPNPWAVSECPSATTGLPPRNDGRAVMGAESYQAVTPGDRGGSPTQAAPYPRNCPEGQEARPVPLRRKGNPLA